MSVSGIRLPPCPFYLILMAMNPRSPAKRRPGTIYHKNVDSNSNSKCTVSKVNSLSLIDKTSEGLDKSQMRGVFPNIVIAIAGVFKLDHKSMGDAFLNSGQTNMLLASFYYLGLQHNMAGMYLDALGGVVHAANHGLDVCPFSRWVQASVL